MGYWACAQLQPNRERLALHCLGLAGFATYLPRLRERAMRHGRRIEIMPALFPGYAFVLIELQWHAARWSPGVVRLVMDGATPAKVPVAVIDGLRAREVGGLIVLPRQGLRSGDAVRIVRGPLTGHLAIYAGMSGPERVAVLLTLLGGPHRVSLPREDVEPV